MIILLVAIVFEIYLNMRENRNLRNILEITLINISAICFIVLLMPFWDISIMLAVLIILIIVNLFLLHAKDNIIISIKNKFLKALILTILITVIFLGGFELIATFLSRLGIIQSYQPLITVYRPKSGTSDWRRYHILADRQYEPDPVLMWRPISQFPFNSQRFIGPEVVIPKPNNVFRIICYGDSNTKNGWPKELQNIIDKNNINRQIKFEVLNAGVDGYTSYQGLKRFQQEVDLYNPDILFVSFGWNDIAITDSIPDKNFGLSNRFMIALERTLLKYNFYLSMKHYIAQTKNTLIKTEKLMHRVSLDDYDSNLKTFIQTAHRSGTRLILLTRPFNLPEVDMGYFRGWRHFVTLYNKKVIEIATNYNIEEIDIQQIFKNKNSKFFCDECHFYSEGLKEMARIIYVDLLKKNLIPH